MNGCHRIVPGTGGLLRTAGHTAISSSCWPRRSIAASAGHHPPTEEALVGTYLKSLPDDRSADVRRWDDADSRVADSDVSAHPSRDVARGRRRPLSDLEDFCKSICSPEPRPKADPGTAWSSTCSTQ